MGGKQPASSPVARGCPGSARSGVMSYQGATCSVAAAQPRAHHDNPSRQVASRSARPRDGPPLKRRVGAGLTGSSANGLPGRSDPAGILVALDLLPRSLQFRCSLLDPRDHLALCPR